MFLLRSSHFSCPWNDVLCARENDITAKQIAAPFKHICRTSTKQLQSKSASERFVVPPVSHCLLGKTTTQSLSGVEIEDYWWHSQVLTMLVGKLPRFFKQPGTSEYFGVLEFGTVDLSQPIQLLQSFGLIIRLWTAKIWCHAVFTQCPWKRDWETSNQQGTPSPGTTSRLLKPEHQCKDDDLSNSFQEARTLQRFSSVFWPAWSSPSLTCWLCWWH